MSRFPTTAFVVALALTPTFAEGQAPAPTPAPAATAAPTNAGLQGRSGEALRLFGRLEDDRAIVYIASGPADARKVVHCPDVFREIEVWTYLEHPRLGKNARVLFFPESGTNEYRYWTLLEGEPVLVAPKASFEKPLPEMDPQKLSCEDAALVVVAVKDVMARQKDKNGGLEERAALAVPHVLPPAGAPKERTPVPLLVSNKPLPNKERKHLTESLPERYRTFLVDVDPIITDLERDTLLRLSTDYQRDRFIEEFWKRRSVAADGMRIAFRDIYELRVRQARERFRNMNCDQAKIFLVNGPPDGFKKINCEEIYWPLEIWYYERIEHLRMSKVVLVFYQSFGAGDFKLWTPLDGYQAIQVGGLPGMLGAAAPPGGRRDVTRCNDYRDVAAALNAVTAMFGTTTSLKIESDLKQGQKPDVEGADQILLMTTDIAPGAASLPLQRTLRFPELQGNKMKMELALLLERDSLGQKQIGDETFFDVDVVGEVVKGERLLDNFRYRFDFPTSSVHGPFVPLTIERELYPGAYQIKVKVADANRNAAALLSEKITVPEVADSTLTPEEKAAREAARAALAHLVANPLDPKGSISFVPLAREIATGLIRFETHVSSSDIAFAEFYLDNTRVLTKRRPPFDADLDLGSLPRKHLVKVVGYAKDGKPVAQDEMILNEGSETFRVRITSPEKGSPLEGPTRVVAEVAVPETKRLKDVEIFINDKRAATLYQPPFSQLVDVPKSKDLGFVRVVASLEDGTATEDIRYFNAPKYLTEVNVHAVELFTSVLAKGKPVTGLTKDNFSIFEDGVPQTVDGFELVTNLPLSIGIGVDTSGSMEETITDAQQAALGFLKDVMTSKDRCFLVSFDNEPQLLSRFTTDRDRLAQALAGLRAQGSTALYDAIIYGLFQYQGTRGRKAYVILTDGEDRSSKFTFEASLDYAKKSGVAIYFIGLRIGPTHMDIRYKLNKMARETGGTVYYIDNAKNLSGIYREINEELRSQYLITYVPQNKSVSNAWRKVDVKMHPESLTARTISGYYAQ